MNYLYLNSRGEPQYRHSFSAGAIFDQCPYKYYLMKVLGWKQKDDKASFHFGRALEQSIQFHHDNSGVGALEDFIQRWQPAKELNLKYTRTERDWDSLLKAGSEMIRLYQIKQPSYPIPLGAQTVFQREYVKELFPGDPNYGGIEMLSKLDIVSYVDPNHPFLPKLDWKPEWGVYRPVIIDIKTADKDFPERPGMAAFDKQIRTYSWMTGIWTAGLLWFKKNGHKLQKGTSVTVLEKVAGQINAFEPGREAVVAKVDGDHSWIVANDYFIGEMEKAGGLAESGKPSETKEAKEHRQRWLNENGVKVENKLLTRQRIQLNIGLVSSQSAADAGQIAGRQVVQIVNSWRSKSWINSFGIRFPSNDMNDPYFRAFVLGEKEFKEQNFKQSDEEEIDEMFEEENDGGAE